jgi:hypothetical protein
MNIDESGIESVARKTGQDVKQQFIWIGLSMTFSGTLTYMHQVYVLMLIELPYSAKFWS